MKITVRNLFIVSLRGSFLFNAVCSFLLCILFISNGTKAQVATYYNFVQSSGTYIPATGGFIDNNAAATNTPASVFATGWDDLSTIYSLPFNFTYNGILYPAGTGKIGLDTDGWFTFSNGNPDMSASTGSGASWVSISDQTGVYFYGTALTNGFAGFNSDLNEQTFATISGTRSNGNNVITGVSSVANIQVGTRLTGSGITNGTIVTAFTATTITMSAPAMNNNTGNNIVPESSIFAFVSGVAPNRQFVIQWTQAKRYSSTGENINFQMILNEGNANPALQTLQVVYGTCTATSATAIETQVGLKGASTSDYNARQSTTTWAATVAATANTDHVRFNNTINPASGLTFTWTPCTVAPSTPGPISGPNPACPTTTQTYSVAAVPGATFYTWNFTGTGATYATTTTAPSNNFTFSASPGAGDLTVTAGNLCGTSSASSISPLTFSSITPATISYPLAAYCSSVVGNITVTQSGTGGGTYSVSPSGLTINTSTGAITPSSSTAGSYTVTYSYSSGGCNLTATASVSIQAPHTVTATANPAYVCVNNPSQLTATANGNSGNYAVSSITYSSLTPSGTPTVLFNSYIDDGNSAAIAMPFSFSFYGSPITQFFVNTNGNVQLQTGVTPGYGPQLIPDVTTPNNIIALCWEDLVIDPSTQPGAYIQYFVNGVSPNRVLVVEYFKLRFLGGTSAENVTGQIRLYESDNHIEVAVGTVNDNGNLYTKTLGIENSTGTLALTPTGRNDAVWNVSNEAWSFNIVSPPSYTYTWTPSTYLNSTSIYNPVSTPTAISTTNYTVTVVNTVNGCSATANVSVTGSNPLNGIYTVGVGGNYTTLTAAVNAYNSLCIGGPVTFSLIDNNYPSETFPIVINSNVYQSSTNTLTIKPAVGKTPLLTGSSVSSLVQLNGADYITIDGSNTTGGITRDLSITNTAASSNAVVWITSASASNGATNNVIKNSAIYGASSTGTIACILAGSAVTAGNDAEFPNNNNTIQNDTLYRAQNAVYQRGNTSSLDQNWIITQNGIGSASVTADKMGFRGIAIINSQNFSVTKNSIRGVTLSSAGFNTYGIALYLNINTGTISENKISDVKHTSVYGAHGIYLGASTTASNITVLNNFIFDVAAAGFNNFTSADNGYGLTMDAGGGYKIYHNTVVLNTNQTNGTNNLRSAAVLVSSAITTVASIDMRNNIFVNSQTNGNANSRYALLSTANKNVYSNINYNGYYSFGSTNLVNLGPNATCNTLAQVQTFVGGNTNSVIGISAAASPTFASATDYHIQSIAANSIVSNLGTPIAGITTDYDITTRNGYTPDIGADEWLMPNTGSWVGKTSIDWLVATNWETNTIPDGTTDVTINGGYTFMPTVVTTQAIRDLNLAAPVPANTPILTINAGTLQINRNITRTGGSIDGSNGTVEMNGTAAQTIPASLFTANNLKNLVIGNNNATGVTLGGALDIYRSLTFSGAGLKLTTGNFLTFKSTATETAWLGNVTGKMISGNATVERYIPNHTKAWQFLSTPTSGQTVKAAWQEGAVTANGNPNDGFGTQVTSNIAGAATQPAPGFDAFTAGGPSMKTYDTVTQKWVGILNTNTLQIANPKGYMLFVRGKRTVTAYNQAATSTILRTTGKLYTTGADAPAVINLSANTFESVGNPYASAIDLTQLARTGGVQDVYYVWDPKLTTAPSVYGYGAFQTFTRNGTSYDVTPGGGSYSSGTAKTIESGQAFFVHATSLTGAVTFTEGAKTIGSNLVTKVFGNNTIGKQLKTNLKVMLSAEPVLIDGNMIQYDAAYSNAIDMEDAEKIGNSGENIGILSNGKTLAVERRPIVQKEDTIFYHMNQLKVQQYQFEFIANDLDQPGLAAFLEDTYLHTSTSVKLQDTTTVMFNVEDVEGSYAPDRFRIVFKQLAPVPVTITSIEAGRNSNRSITIKWKVQNELNIQLYSLERSANGINFTGMLTAFPLANNGAASSYARNDINPLNGDNFYRIKAVSVNGSIQYSAIVKVSPLKTVPAIIVSPNPVVNKSLQLQFINEPDGTYNISLLNKLGQQVFRDDIIISGGNMARTLQLDAGLASGTYQVVITGPGSAKISQQVIIQ